MTNIKLKQSMILFAVACVTNMMVNITASADATIQIDADQSKATLAVKDSRVLIKSTANNSDVLFDSNKQVLYVIDHTKRTVSPINQQVVQQLSTHINGAISALQKQLASMPPEQRAQMEQFMGGFGLQTKQPEKPTASLIDSGSKQYSGINCNENKVMQGNEHIGTICLSQGNNTELSDDDYNTLLEAQIFMFNLTKQAGQFAEKFGQQLPSFGDIQLSSLIIHSQQIGGQATTFKVTDINQQAIDQALTVPSGYQTENITNYIQ